MATFQNRATLTYDGVTTLSNTVTGELVDALTVTKTATVSTYGEGSTVTYIVSITNTGATPIGGITVTDDLGAYPFGAGTLVPLTYVDGSVRYFVNGAPTPAPVPTATSPLTFTGLSVPAGGNVQLVYVTAVNEFAPLGADASVTNTATVGGAGITPITAGETVTAADTDLLAVEKQLSPTVVTDGDTVTYTLTVRNFSTSPVTAEGGAVLADVFDPILTLLAVTLDGAPLTAGTDYTYDAASGSFTTLPGALTVPGATATQDPVTGAYTLEPGVTTLVIAGTVNRA